MAVERPSLSSLAKDLIGAFNWMQREGNPTGKAVMKLRKIYEAAEAKEKKTDFFKIMTFLIQLPLTSGSIKERMSKVDEKILETVCKFTVSYLQDEVEKRNAEKAEGNQEEDEEDLIELPWLLRRFFDWLLDHHEVEGSQARLRICLMVNRLLRLLGEDAEIDDELFQKIYDNMLERLKDKVAEIRAQAVTALQRLQNPRDPNCPIVQAFMFHLTSDPSPVVRRTIVKCIGASRTTLPYVVRRTLDVDDSVRRASYKFLAEKIHIKSLTINQREEIIKRGLTDRDENVKKFVGKTLVPAWLRLCNDSVVEFLYALDVGNSDGDTAKEVLNVIFSQSTYKDLVDGFNYLDPTSKLVPEEKLSPETAVFWNHLAKYLATESEKGVQEAGEMMEKICPELTQFCSYLRSYVFDYKRKEKKEGDVDEEEEAKEVAWFFVSKQLLDMTSAFDFSDEMGRQSLSRLCREILSSKKVPIGFTEPAVRVFAKVQPNPNSRIQEIAEVISELREEDDDNVRVVNETLDSEEEPEEVLSKGEKEKLEENQRKRQVEAAKLRVKLNILKNDLENAISCQDFMKAQEIKLEMDGLEGQLNVLLEPIIPERSFEKKKKQNHEEKEQEVIKEKDPNEEIFVIRKALEMISILLESSDIKSLNGTLLSLLDEFIVPSIQNMDFNVRKQAVKAIGQCGVRDLGAAKRNLLLVVQVIQLDALEVRLAALEVIYDLLMWHGLTAFNDGSGSKSPTSLNDEAGSTRCDDDLESILSGTSIIKKGQNLTQIELDHHGASGVVAVLSHLLDEPDMETRTLVIEGLCKLMMCGSIASPKLISRLILIWYNPVTDPNGKLRHILGTFFPLYASFSKANQDVIEESFAMTLNTLFEAPVTSPLAEVDVEDVGTFYLQLTRSDLLQNGNDGDTQSSTTSCAHDSMAFSLCNLILNCPDSCYVKTLIKLLTMLQITTNDFVKLREMKTMNDQMREEVKDKNCLKTLEKFGSRLEECIKLDPENEKTEPEKREESAANEDKSPEDLEVTANVTKMGSKKRALFNETCNTLLDLTSQPEADVRDQDGFKVPSLPPSISSSKSSLASSSTSSMREPPSKVTKVVESENTSEESDEGVSVEKEAPKGSTGEKKRQSNSRPKRFLSRRNTSSSSSPEKPPKKVTRVEESEDSDDDDDDDKVVSGNIFTRRPLPNQTLSQTSCDNVFTSTQASSTMISSEASTQKHSQPTPRRSPRVVIPRISVTNPTPKPAKTAATKSKEKEEKVVETTPSTRRSKRTLTATPASKTTPNQTPSSTRSTRSSKKSQELDSSKEFETPPDRPRRAGSRSTRKK